MFFVQAHYSNPIFKLLDSKFNLSKEDNIIYIFQSKHKKSKLTPQDIKNNALIVVKKLHQWKVPFPKIIQVLHIKGLPRFVPQKMIRKKLNKKAKVFEDILLPMLDKDESQSFQNIQFHWYIDQNKKFFKDLQLNLDEPHLFVKSKGIPAKKSSPKLLKKNDFYALNPPIKSKQNLQPKTILPIN